MAIKKMPLDLFPTCRQGDGRLVVLLSRERRGSRERGAGRSTQAGAQRMLSGIAGPDHVRFS